MSCQISDCVIFVKSSIATWRIYHDYEKVTKIQDDRLLYPIIQPCNWILRWRRNGTVIKEAKVKYFTGEDYELYCDQFLYIEELIIDD